MLAFITLGSQSLHLTTGSRQATHVEGLIGPPGARGDAYNRPEQDGAVSPFRAYMPARLITIEAQTWVGGTIDLAWADWRLINAQLEAALTTDTLLQWQHVGDTVTMQQYVRLADASLPVQSEDENYAVISYNCVLRAADPRWESSVASSSATPAPSATGGMPIPVVFPIPFGAGATGGSVIITNGGTTTAWPIITVQGPANGPQITCSTQGKFLSFDTLTLGAGDVLTVDMHPSVRTCTVNGLSVMGSLRMLDSSFFGLRAGVAETVAFTALGGGTSAASLMTVSYRPSYLG